MPLEAFGGPIDDPKDDGLYALTYLDGVRRTTLQERIRGFENAKQAAEHHFSTVVDGDGWVQWDDQMGDMSDGTAQDHGGKYEIRPNNG